MFSGIAVKSHKQLMGLYGLLEPHGKAPAELKPSQDTFIIVNNYNLISHRGDIMQSNA